MNEIELTPYTPADHTWLVDHRQTLYCLNDGFDDSFGQFVNDILKDFEANSDPSCEMGWIARDKDGLRLGSIFALSLMIKRQNYACFCACQRHVAWGLVNVCSRVAWHLRKPNVFNACRCGPMKATKRLARYTLEPGWACVSSKPVHSLGVFLIEQQWEITL